MNYRTLSDLARIIDRSISLLSTAGYSKIVGLPRSGMLPAYMIGLRLNLEVCTLDEYLAEVSVSSGLTRAVRRVAVAKILVVDDSINSGASINAAREAIRASGLVDIATHFCAVYYTKNSLASIDIGLERVELPRVFEWNVLHRRETKHYCFDIDGVLCDDPSSEQNDDSSRYEEFLIKAQPKFIPTYPVGWIVTSRLEKYRSLTLEWLSSHNVVFEKLEMLDLNSAEERRRLGVHADFKARTYLRSGKKLFIESETNQAERIALLSGMPVLSTQDFEFYEASKLTSLARAKVRRVSSGILRRFKNFGN